jgi:hypothetical protein
MTAKEKQQLNQLGDLATKLSLAKSLCKTEKERQTLDLLGWIVRRKQDQIDAIVANRKIRRRF